MKRDIGALVERDHELLIIGGGIYGAAAAWDAAQRGLQVALVEKGDFGGSTSWNSLKTIHGGLRHLQRLELSLLRESVRERRALLRIAPEIVRPLPFLVPTYGHGPRGREALALGLWLYDRIAEDRNDGVAASHHVPASRMLSTAEVRERIPGVSGAGLTGGALWHDAQVVASERLVMGFLHAAAGAGAIAANALEVDELILERGRARGVRAIDHETGARFEIRARTTLCAAGPGIPGLLRRGGVSGPRVPLLRAWNLVLRRNAAGGQAVGGRSGGRFLFLVPWGDRAIVGTEYESAEAPGAPDRLPRFLDAVRDAFPWAGIVAEDVTLVHLGLVPGERDAAGLWSHSLVVDHAESDGVAGLVSVLGAKYTTARAVAETAIDKVTASLGRGVPACRTADSPLPQARPLEGSVADQAREAARNEMALHLADVVLRRTSFGTAEPPAEAVIEALGVAMAGELSWDAARLAAERDGLRAALAAHQPRLR